MAKNFKFPDPVDYPPKHPVVMCPGERVLILYTQGTGDSAQRISAKVRTWFSDRAAAEGWAATHFLPEVQSLHGAGCLLLSKGNAKVTNVASAALGLVDTSDDEDVIDID